MYRSDCNFNNSRIAPAIVMLLSGLTACKEPEPDYTTVAVYPSTLACVVKEVPVQCEQVAIYLRDTLKVGANHQIIVSEVSSDPVSKEDVLLDRIADGVRKIGYKNVRTSSFDLK